MKKTANLKRTAAVMAAAALAGTSLAACGSSASSAPATTAAAAQTAAPAAQAAAPAAQEAAPAQGDKPYAGTKLTWWTKLNANVSASYPNLGDTPWAKYVMEKTGIEIVFEHPTVGSEDEEFSIMVASGDYPDIIENPWTKYPGGAGAAIGDGVIIDLNDIMGSKAPNLKKVLEGNPELDKMIRSSSGDYYCFPFLRGTSSPNNTQFSSGMTYRADVLKELGLEVPETAAEWEEVLRAYKNAGFDVPFTTRNEWMKDVWSPAFDNWGSFYVDNGVVKNGLIEDSRKEFISTMAAWYKEGLIDNDWLVADKKSNQTYFTTGKSAVVYAPFGQGLGTYTKVMNKENPAITEECIQCAPPVTSKHGQNAKFSKMNNIYDQSGVSAAISTQCKNPEAAAWLLDWMFSEEGHMINNFGIEGETYTMVDGKPVYTDLVQKNPDGKSSSEILAAYTRASTSGVCVQDPRYIEEYYVMDNQKEALKQSMKTDMGQHFFPPTSVSEDNRDEYAEIMNNVKTLSDEMEAQFIAGTVSMDQWDAYQKQLKDFGIEKAIQMMQDAYNEYNK